MIPTMYEVSKNDIIKHGEIFKEIISLRKLDFIYRVDATLSERTKSQLLIHNELNFIFQILNKHPQLNKNPLFLYMRECIINISFDIGKNL